MDLYGRAFRRFLFPAWERLLGARAAAARYDYLDRSQWRSLDELTALQEGALRRFVHAAAHRSPEVRARFDAAGLEATNVRRATDLLTLPPLREPGRAGEGDAGWTEAAIRRAYGWASEYEPGENVLRFGARPTGVFGQIAARAIRDARIDEGEEGVREVARRLHADPPRLLVCEPQGGVALAEFLASGGNGIASNVPMVAMGLLSPAERVTVERAFGDGVFEVLGVPGLPFVAGECAAHEGLHESMETVLVEIVRTGEGGRPRHAAPGEEGDIVVTDLHDVARPLLRFATGLRGVRGPLERCACSRGLRRLRVVGPA